MNLKDNLANLLNDYICSEAELYLKMKQELTEGKTFTFNGYDCSSKIKDSLDWLFFIEVLSKHSINFNADKNIDVLIKPHFFHDERLEIKVQDNQKMLTHFKVNLSDYSSLVNNPIPPRIKKSSTKYKIHIKLLQSNNERKDFENSFIQNPELFAQELINEICENFKMSINSDLFKRAEKKKTYQERIKLWGFSSKNSKDLLDLVKNLTPQDFGIKDITQLYIVKELFFKDKLSNKTLFSQSSKYLKSRKKQYESK